MSQTTPNRTFIGSVVFLDIVEYSQQPVDEQIRLKNRFNAILAEAIKDVAVNDRIILDTGDGAAISFLGDPEDALFVGLNIRDAIIAQKDSSTPSLSVRTGINLGPVKLVQGIDGRRNLLGDGINVAQRVMSFSEPGQVLVSSSYFEVISRLSQEYAKLFHFEGSRADKNIREHQVYSVGPVEKENIPLPPSSLHRKEEQRRETVGGDKRASSVAKRGDGQGDKTVTAEQGQPLWIATAGPPSPRLDWKKLLDGWGAKWLSWKERWGGWAGKWLTWDTLRNHRKVLYAVAALVGVLISVPIVLWIIGEPTAKAPGALPSAASVATKETTEKAKAAEKAKVVDTSRAAEKQESPGTAKKTKASAGTRKTETPAEVKKVEGPSQGPEEQRKTEAAPVPQKSAAPAMVSLGIAPWGEVYVDGDKKGVSPPLNNLKLAPGKHQIEIRNTTFPSYTQDVDLKPGEELKIRHKFR